MKLSLFFCLFVSVLSVDLSCSSGACICAAGLRAVQFAPPSFNGCGTKGMNLDQNEPMVVDCCNNHDKCYGTLGSKKATCDATFCTCLNNAKTNFLVRSVFCTAVRTFGESAFETAQKTHVNCN
eukprot:NODE_10712_length_497_cov_7.168449_g10061_i0.p1 GENE.NODE_10712_length_497_cov_7.168449_g10061_i0~~NODE_10712_length_497_cov_7.168449_g10061_i0.p1  ORF type:complete len:140 (+),score=9.37 NODE_10712_length_497_cov_7.168449_g10061_i0:50-421(+)